MRIIKREGWYSITSDVVIGLFIAHPDFATCVKDIPTAIMKLIELNKIDIDRAMEGKDAQA